MGNYSAAFTALKASINTRVTTKNTINSIDPVDVGGSMTDVLDLLLPIANLVNAFGILSGDIPPTDAVGTADSMYFEFGTQLKVWKRENVSSPFWELKASGDLGINVLDGNINVQVSVNENTAAASTGQWALDNVIYEAIEQTEFSIPSADLNFDRIDLITGDTSNVVNYTTGVASSTPAQPAIPSNNVRINLIYVPSTSSGNLPYVQDTNAPPVVPPQLAKLSFTDANLVADGEDNWYLPVSIPIGRFPVGVIIDYGGGDVQYMPGGNVVDGKISGFTNNNTSLITIKLG
jgi:hypothetical protein